MPRDTLLDVFEDLARLDAPFLVHDDGYRSRTASYAETGQAARIFADRLRREGVATGDHVVIWSENSIEWVVAFWGAVVAGVVVVPVDYRASADYLTRIAGLVRAKAILVGEEVTPPTDAGLTIWRLADVIRNAPAGASPGAAQLPNYPITQLPNSPSSSTLAEILFTSGATADPKGVTITHRNLLANIVPLEREVRKYRKYMRPFDPLRFLNLLPLSHMFGQSMATFVPPMIAGTVVFIHGYNPTEIIRQIKSRRISVLVCVPKVLDMLASHVRHVSASASGPEPPPGTHWVKRWWRYRDVHRMFGWKFWCVVVGAAPLEPELERFWRRLGFGVVQGYGLTETAPIVTLNHPLRASMGSVGRPIAGVDVRIAPDGEILVRGDNVTSGYYHAPGEAAETASPIEQGWFHTGDIGDVDATGRLTIKGRKKEMIVTPEGMKVFPEDVERVLNAEPGVRESAVVGLRAGSEERVHAVLVVEPGADIDAIVRHANPRLEDHQRIRSASRWPGERLPRTEGTQKLKRRELQGWAAGGATGASSSAAAGATVEAIVATFTPARDLKPETTLDELGLSSLDQIELMMALEEAFHVTLDESAFAAARTLAGLKHLVEPDRVPAMPAGHDAGDRSSEPPAGTASSRAVPGPHAAAMVFPSWNRSSLARATRRVALPVWLLPLARIWVRVRVDGLDHLRAVRGPVLFAANHQSMLDVPAILLALPAPWRYRLATAMAKERFAAHFDRREAGWGAWFRKSLSYYLACLFFNAFPLPQRDAGTRQTLRYIGEVAEGGDSILIFPEGKRTEHGEIAPFRPGVGMIAARLGLTVVPLRIEGLDRVLHIGERFPTRGPVRVAFGAPLTLTGDDYPALAAQVEEAVREL